MRRDMLIRVVRRPDGTVAFDAVQKVAGRGAYVCRNMVCVSQATRKGGLARALKRTVPEGVLLAVREMGAANE